jgi:beta-glucosidase
MHSYSQSSLLRNIGLLAFLFLFSVSCLAQGGSNNNSSPDYLNPSLPIERRVDDLVSRMTLEEKASQVVHRARAIPRLGIPAYNWWSEALHGVVASGVTVFPEPIGLGATFDAPLIHDMATVIGTEARARHHEQVRQGDFMGTGLDFWAPNLNIFRDPRWGRGQETYGEDPFLTGRMGVAFVSGMQGDDARYLRTIATPKHYAVHSGPEPVRHTIDVKVSRHDMEDTYLPAFRAAVTEGQAGSVMCVYNRVNGEPGCANNFLLGDQLRGKWGFRGYVVSDCDAVYDIQRGHHYTQTVAEAAAVSVKRGTDLDCNDPGDDYSRYMDAVKQGLLSEQELTVAVKRLFRARFALGMFDPPEAVPYAQTPAAKADAPAHRELSARLARESMVLLKNDGMLPLRRDTKKILVVGPLADSTRVLQGNYNGSNPKMVSVLDGIRRQFTGASVSYVPGTYFLRDSDPIPNKFLSSGTGTQGLKGEYFKGINLAGEPVATRVDKKIDFDFAGDGAPGLGRDNFSVRWTGILTPTRTNTYRLGVTADDGYRLWLDGKLLVEDWTDHAPTTKAVDLELKAGQEYSLKLEYYQKGGGAVVKLFWIPQGQRKPESQLWAEAAQAARKVDAVIAVVGITSDLEGEEMPVAVPGFSGGDRTSLELPKDEESLLKAVKTAGKPLAIVLMNGSALSVNWAAENANALLEAWYPGEEGGTAVAETLAGSNNPAGRLPVTFYRSVEQLPAFDDYSMENRTYRYFKGSPLFPFGYGLSYSKFSYANLKLSADRVEPGDSLIVEADVRNASRRAGDEVVQLYLTFPKVAGAPLRALQGFTRITLAPGEVKHVSFKLSPRELSIVNETGNRIVVAGDYHISIGGGQPGTGAPNVEGRFSVAGEQGLAD